MKKYKDKIKRSFAEGLSGHIAMVVMQLKTSDSDEDKMLAANLAQVYEKILEKLVRVKPVYSITLTPAEAFAVCVLRNDFPSANFYISNNMLALVNNVQQYYAQPEISNFYLTM